MQTNNKQTNANACLHADIKKPPKETPIRILVCVWWLSTIVIVNIYLGILFAQLVIPRQPRSIETLEELVSQDEVKWCVTRGSALDELFRRSKPETIYGQLASRMLNVSSADEGVERVRRSGWAFIRERSILEFKVSFLAAISLNWLLLDLAGCVESSSKGEGKGKNKEI